MKPRDSSTETSKQAATPESSNQIGGAPETETLRESDADASAASQLEVALYIEQLSVELCGLARNARLDSLAYFLDMVRIEAALKVREERSR